MTSITYTAVLDVGRETAETLARLLREHRERLGTRKGTRALGVFKQGFSSCGGSSTGPGWPNSPATTGYPSPPPTVISTRD